MHAYFRFGCLKVFLISKYYLNVQALQSVCLYSFTIITFFNLQTNLLHTVTSQWSAQAKQRTTGVKISRHCYIYPRRRACKGKNQFKMFFRRTLTVPKKSHSAHSPSFYMAPYPNTLTRLIRDLKPISIGYQTHPNVAQNQKVVGSQSESSTKNPKFRQPIGTKSYVTQKHPRALG